MINKDMFSIVFRYLPVKDRATCRAVCSGWFAAAAEFNEWTGEQYIDCIEHNLLHFIQRINIDPSFKNNLPIRRASCYGRTKIVQLLLADPRVDPAANDNEAIQIASNNGHVEIVKLLLADLRVDPSADNYYTLKVAVYNGHNKIVKLLLLDPRKHIDDAKRAETEYLWTR